MQSSSLQRANFIQNWDAGNIDNPEDLFENFQPCCPSRSIAGRDREASERTDQLLWRVERQGLDDRCGYSGAAAHQRSADLGVPVISCRINGVCICRLFAMTLIE